MTARNAKLPPLEGLGDVAQALEAVRQFQRCREIVWQSEHQAAQYSEGCAAWCAQMDKARRYQARGELWLQLLETWLEKEALCP